MTVQGTCATEFDGVRDEFERNFTERDEVGASLHVTVEGETVVDLWGGIADPATGRPWTEDTLVHVWSCTKGATALCAHILASRGEIDLDAPVVEYWPEFGKNGKDGILVRQLLNHQAGLPGVREPLPPRAFYDWDYMVDVLAREEPFWKPGTAHGYEGLTSGWLVGEIVRRVGGKSLGTFFRTEVAEPLGLEFWIGLPEELEPRVAPNIRPDLTEPGIAVPTMFITAMTDPTSIQAYQVGNTGGYFDPGESDTRAARATEIGAVGGITNAKSLAHMYRPLALGGEFGGVRLVDEGHIAVMGAVSSASDYDMAIQVRTRFSLGFVKAIDNRHQPNPGDQEGFPVSEEAFGHGGIGGSAGFCDPRARMSFGYAMNRMGTGVGMNERGVAVIDATYRALGYRQPPSGGIWYAP